MIPTLLAATAALAVPQPAGAAVAAAADMDITDIVVTARRGSPQAQPWP
jgi:hypothetical protein